MCEAAEKVDGESFAWETTSKFITGLKMSCLKENPRGFQQAYTWLPFSRVLEGNRYAKQSTVRRLGIASYLS